MTDPNELIGKTIIKAEINKISDEFDDEPFLDLTLDTGEIIRIIANYGGYTGKSEDEYRRFIRLEELKKKGAKEE